MMKLEDFFIQFSVDAKPLFDAMGKVNQVTKQTETNLKNINSPLREAMNGFQGLARTVLGAATAYLSLSSVISGLKGSYSYALQVGEASRALRVNTEELDAWSRAVQLSGGSAQSLQSSVTGLARSLNITNSQALKLLPMLSNTFSKVKGERAINLAARFGIDQGTVLLLQQGRREVETLIKRQKELGTVTREDAERALLFNRAWTEAGFAFNFMWQGVVTSILPTLTAVTKAFTGVADYFRKHSNLIKGALIAIGVAAGFVAVPLIIINAKLLLISGAVTGLISLFAILYEDIKAFNAGTESGIGLLLDKFPKLKSIFESIKEILSGIAATWKYITTGSLEGFKNVNYEALYRNKSGYGTALAYDTGLPSASSILDSYSGSPINNMSSSSISNSSSSSSVNSTSMRTGNITINAPTREGQDIAAALKTHLSWSTGVANVFDDGKKI